MLGQIFRCTSVFLFFSLLSFFSIAQEDVNTPDGLVRMVVNDVMSSIKKDPAMQKGDIKKIQALVQEKILPHVNFEKTTSMVMGRNWKEATPAQQTQIINEFQQLLIHTYAGAIAKIRDQQVQFGPARLMNDKGDNALVPTTVFSEGDKLQMHYRLEKADGQWKVYDMNILGIWLIGTYKTQFQQQITDGGIDGLISFLKTRNQQLTKGKS